MGKTHPISAAGSGYEWTYLLSNYMFGAPIGNVWYVLSGAGTDAGGGSRGLSPEAPLATIDYAVGLCVANNDDVIVVLPGHAETLSAAGAITVDVAGVTILGMGSRSNRPTLSFAHTAATFAISAANVTVKNLRVTATVDEAVKLFHVTAAGCTIDGVDYFETTSAQALQFLLTTNAADHLTIQNCYHRQDNAGGSAQNWIALIGVDDARILDNTFLLTLNNAAASYTIGATTAVINCHIARNTIIQLGGTTQVSAIFLTTSSTGFVHDNRVASAFTIIAGSVALASAFGAENYCVNTVNKSGILDPVADNL